MADHSTPTDTEERPTAAATDSDPIADDVPEDVATEAERLTHLAREAVVDQEADAYRSERDRLLAQHDFLARVREEDDTLVLHPDEWVEDGTVYPSRIDDTDRAVEVSLSGPGDPDEWESVEQYNTEIVEAVRTAHGDVHAANARAFADFMGNHYARRVDSASAEEIREFIAEYFPRNAWPSAEQKQAVEQSIDLVFEAADAEAPQF
jgi:hypothetical protein